MSNRPTRKHNILCLTLPIPPGINEQYATVNGHRVSSAAARRFKQEVRQKLAALEREGTLNEEIRHRLRQGYLSLLLAFYFETPLKRDLDGGLKIAQDSLCDGIGLNDNRVVSIHLLKYIDPLHPHLDVEIESLEDWRFDEEYKLL
ncbi:MAG TPA: RusA family crossover junction endodeoxyribonuclease [Ktedonobacteraceae bacterium]|nr:RusA family crossover junction endodeoxyribonuclease [Ktedonobacteraceae bacterium]